MRHASDTLVGLPILEPGYVAIDDANDALQRDILNLGQKIPLYIKVDGWLEIGISEELAQLLREKSGSEGYVEGILEVKDLKALTLGGEYPEVFACLCKGVHGEFGVPKIMRDFFEFPDDTAYSYLAYVDFHNPNFHCRMADLRKLANWLGIPGGERKLEQLSELDRVFGKPKKAMTDDQSHSCSENADHRDLKALGARERNSYLRLIGLLLSWLQEKDQINPEKPYSAAESIMLYADNKGKSVGAKQSIGDKIKVAMEEWSNSN